MGRGLPGLGREAIAVVTEVAAGPALPESREKLRLSLKNRLANQP